MCSGRAFTAFFVLRLVTPCVFLASELPDWLFDFACGLVVWRDYSNMAYNVSRCFGSVVSPGMNLVDWLRTPFSR